jgi:hypothetical protein
VRRFPLPAATLSGLVIFSAVSRGIASRPRATCFNASGVANGALAVSRDQFRAPKGQTVTARGGTPGTTPHNVLRALKGHTGQGACGHRSPRWGEVSWHGMTQGSAPLHLGLSPCAALRRERARDACPEDASHDPPRGEFPVSREQFPELTAGNREPATYAGGVAAGSPGLARMRLPGVVAR